MEPLLIGGFFCSGAIVSLDIAKTAILAKVKAKLAFDHLAIGLFQAIEIVPAMSIEGIDQQGAAHHEAHLLLGHTGLQLVNHVLVDHMSLLDFNPVDAGEERAATEQQSAAEKDCLLHSDATSNILFGGE